MPLRNSWPVRWVVAAALAAAALVVAFAFDHPTERWVTAHRTSGATSFFRAATHLGDPTSALWLGVVLVAFAAFRSVRVALAVLAVTLIRPIVATVGKELFDRQRPRLSPLVHASGDSFPSGHTLAATVLWGCVPAVMLAWRAGRDLVRLVIVLVALIVLAVGVSRIYLGVHWLSDVTGGALLGALLLVVVYRQARRP